MLVRYAAAHVTPDGEAIAGQTLRYRQRRVSRKRRAQATPTR